MPEPEVQIGRPVYPGVRQSCARLRAFGGFRREERRVRHEIPCPSLDHVQGGFEVQGDAEDRAGGRAEDGRAVQCRVREQTLRKSRRMSISYTGNIYRLASYVIIDVENLIVPPDKNK